MPLINCPDCNKEMSDAAPSCINCGKPNTSINKPYTPPPQPAHRRSVGFWLGLGIVFMPFIFAWFTLRKGHSTSAILVSFAWLCLLLFGPILGDKDNAVTTKQVQEPIAEATAREIISAYRTNEVGADNAYKGKIIAITGQVDDVKKDILDNMYVTLGTGALFELPQVQAFFEDDMADRLGELRKGQTVTVVCRMDGLMMNVLGRKCRI